MAIRFSEFPIPLIGNKCYEFMMENYKPGVFWWNYDSVVQYGSLHDLKKVLSFGAAIKTKDKVKLTFVVTKTLPHIILEFTRNKTMVFSELLMKLNNGKAFSTCDAARLKNLLSYLMNFHQVQLFNLPFSGLTLITADDIRRDP